MYKGVQLIAKKQGRICWKSGGLWIVSERKEKKNNLPGFRQVASGGFLKETA